MTERISFILDGREQTLEFKAGSPYTPTTTVLQYLRSLPNHKGVKEGCAEGDCGACTVVLAEPDGEGKLQYKAVNSCLIFLPKLHGKQLITVENLQDAQGRLHPVQQYVAEGNGAQCGFCTPGIVMSLFGHYKTDLPAERDEIEDTLSGNLCRCTGYQPILEAAVKALEQRQDDSFTKEEQQVAGQLNAISANSVRIQTDSHFYSLPTTLNEAFAEMEAHPDALVLNGATDVALKITKQHQHLPEIIDLSLISELKEVEETADGLRLGAGVSVNDALVTTRAHFPAIYRMAKRFGSKQIRHLATVGGNLSGASPIGDLTPVLMAHKAQVIVTSAAGQRKMDLDAFITGYRQTALQPGELLTHVEIPFLPEGVKTGAYKVSKRRDLDIATVSAAFRLELTENSRIKEAALVYGGMAAMTQHARQTEAFLQGKEWNRATAEAAAERIQNEFEPISDARAGAEFRRIVAGNVFIRFWADGTNAR